MTVTTWTVPDPRVLFDDSMEAVKTSCIELQAAAASLDPGCAIIAETAVHAWIAARWACRTLFMSGRSGSPDPFAEAARLLLLSQARVLVDLLMQAALTPFATSVCTRLKAQCSLLMGAMDVPLVERDRGPQGRERRSERPDVRK